MKERTPSEYARQVRDLFEEASRHPFESRVAFLEKTCGEDTRLLEEVSALLERAELISSQPDTIAEEVIWPSLQALGDDPSRMALLVDPSGAKRMGNNDPRVGTTVSHFDILSVVGYGGMGVIYRARDTTLERDVALKFLSPGLYADEKAREQLIVEARSTATLDHPNVATIHEVGETDDKQIFLAMGFYEGETLKERLGKGPIAQTEALDILIQVGQGIAAAHDRGIIHGDIKPGNIMLTDEGRVKLLDFGLARHQDAAARTRTEQLVGTVAYMAPEQIRHETAGKHSDIWSMGVVLYEMLTGGRPFGGDHIGSVLSKILDKEPSGLGALEPEIAAIVTRCLAKDPGKRYQSAGELLAVATQLHTGAPVHVLEAATRTSLRSPALIALAAAVVVLSATLSVWIYSSLKQPVGPPGLIFIDAKPVRSIAVLPFVNLTSFEERSSLVDGIHEGTTTRIASIHSLNIVSRRSTLAYRDSDLPLSEIAEALGVDALLTGSVQVSEDRLIVSTQLIEAATERHLWADSYDRQISTAGIFSIQEDIVGSIVAAIGTVVPSAGAEPATSFPTDNFTALEQYYKGRAAYFEFSISSREDAVEFYREAIRNDPGFAPAHAALAETLITQVEEDGFAASSNFPEAERSIASALEFNPNLGEAYLAIGRLKRRQGQPGEARVALQRAIDLSPNNPECYIGLGNILLWYYHHSRRAIALFEKAIQLAPDRYGDQMLLVIPYWWRQRDEEGLEITRNAILHDPEDWNPHCHLGYWNQYGPKPDWVEAVRRYRKAHSLNPHSSVPPFRLAVLYRALGDNENAAWWLERTLRISPDSIHSEYQQGILYDTLGARQLALQTYARVTEETGYQKVAFMRTLQELVASGRLEDAINLCREIQPTLLGTLVSPPREGAFASVPDPFYSSRGRVGRVDPLQTKDPIINYRLEIEIPDHSVINPDSTRATFYLKIARPSEQPLPGHFFARWGLASSRELEGQHATEVQFVTNTMLSDSGIRRSPRTEAPDEPNHEAIEPDTYHELWYLMDRSRGTFDLYIRGGSLQEQTLLSKDVPMIDEADTPLDIFSLFCSVLSSGGPLYLDDLYIDSHSHNLGDPDSKWMLIDDFEDGDIGEWVVRRHTGMSDEDFALAFEVASVLKEGGDVNAAERIHDEILRRVDRWNIHSVEHLRTVVRVHALRGNKDEVLKYLRIMSELGARDSDLAGKPEFSSLANNVEFRQIMEEFETRRLSAISGIQKAEVDGMFDPIPPLPDRAALSRL